MDNKKRKKYDRIAKITGILAGLILVLGTSYAVFRTVTTGEQGSVISAGKLDVRIENEQDEITLENAFPITEEEGKKQTPYTFDVVNEGTINAEYDLYIEIDESVSTLPVDVVRYYLTVEEDGTEKIVTSSARTISQEEVIEKEGKKLYKIDNKYLDTEKSNHYKLYLWVDYDATTEQATNKTFEAKVSIEAAQIYDKNRLIQQIDVSQNGDGSVMAYMYADRNVIVKGQGAIKSNLSSLFTFINEDAVENYKKVFRKMGIQEETINSLQTAEDISTFMSNFSEDQSIQFEMCIYIQILEEFNYDTSSITDLNTLMAFMLEQGLIDSEGNPGTDENAQSFYKRIETVMNEDLALSPIPAKSIVLEDGITNIPEGLFTGNEDIVDVKIPASVTSIDTRAFYGCTGLKEVVLPNSITNIGERAFYNCTSLNKIKLSDNLKTIGNLEFYNCKNITEITLPSSIESIGEGIFTNCSNLKKLSLDGTKSAYAITNVNNPFRGVTLDELYIFGEGKIIDMFFAVPLSENAKVTFANTITSIGNSFLSGNVIKSITIPSSITDIGEDVLWRSLIENITIPSSVETIGDGSFSGCRNLAAIEVDENNENYTAVDGVLFTKDMTKLVAYPSGKEDTFYAIPDTVTNVGDMAFDYSSNITSLEISKNTIQLGAAFFQYGNNITELKIDGTVAYQHFPNDFNKVKDVTLTGEGNMYTISTGRPWQRSVETVVIEEGITNIGSDGFKNCTKLRSIELPNSITSIEDEAFSGCSNLVDITIPEHVTEIRNDAFQNCTSLTSINIPGSVSRISGFAFSGCTGIKEITIPNSVTNVYERAFYGWTATQIINIDNTESYVEKNWAQHKESTDFSGTHIDYGWYDNCDAQINYLRT